MKKEGFVLVILVFASLISGCGGIYLEDEDNNSVDIELNTTNSTENDTINSTQEENNSESNSTGVVGTCVDSDEGKIFDTVGYVRINGSKTYLDSCISEFTLREYYCNDTYPGTVEFDVFGCFDICENGACIVVEDNETNSSNTSNSS
jgi:hypothetical protein